MTGRSSDATPVATTPDCPSRFLLERYWLGELEDAQARRIQAHLDTCAHCRKRVAAFEEERAGFLRTMPFDAFYRDLEARWHRADAQARSGERTGASRSGAAPILSRWHRFLVGVVERLRALSGPRWVLAAAATALVLVVVPQLGRLPGLLDSGPRVKAPAIGPGPLEVILLRGGRISPAESGDVFHAGDRLQFRVTPGTWHYLHLVSLDDQGKLTPFFPDDGSPSLALRPDPGQLLPGAVVLDDFVGLERIFAVFSPEPLDYGEVEEAARRLVDRSSVPLDLAHITQLPIEGTAQVSFLMVKE